MDRSIISASLLLCNFAVSAAGTQLSISPSLLYFDYTEFSTSDQVLDNETGWLPGLEARLSRPLNSSWIVDLYTSYYQGKVAYDGQRQSGTSHSTDTATNILRFGARLETIIYNNTGLYISMQSQRWKRDIQDNNNVSGITENYEWLEYSAGLSYQLYSSDQDRLELDAGLLITRNADLDVDLSRVGLGTTTLDLGDGTGSRLKLFWNRQYQKDTSYGLGFFYEAWEFGRSNTKATQGGTTSVYVTEPRSETRNIGLQFNFKYLF